jgi:hypothetical protein
MGGLVWLASYPKSGNTWMRNFLHNALTSGHEAHDINKMRHLTTWDSASTWYASLLDKPLHKCSKQEVAEIRMQANQRIAESTDGLVFVKTHNAMVADRGYAMVNPSVTAGAVYIIRNPLDVVVSYSHHLSFSIDETIEYMALTGAQHANTKKMAYEVQSSWSENVYSWTHKNNPSLYVVKYEDMLENTQNTFKDLLSFLQIKLDEQGLLTAIEASSFKKLKQQEQRHGFEEKPKNAKEFFRKGVVDDWKNVLSNRQVDKIVSAHEQQMTRFGYLP